tara:strand:- start:465 stop:671 length:207 start_codon:yes stop_codon:yes gene_type:complete
MKIDLLLLYLICFQANSFAQISLDNATGKLISIPVFKNAIDIVNLAPGIYMLQLKTELGMVTQRFTKI